MNFLNVGIIGCGNMGKRHAEILKNMEQVRIVAVCDLNEERAKFLSESLGVPYYLDYKTMLKEQNIDVVDILTPPGVHGEIAFHVIEGYNAHLIIEKPITLDLEEAKALVERARERGVYVITVYQNRCNLPIRRVKDLINRRILGTPVLASVNLYWCRHQDYYDAYPWRGKWHSEGGVLANQGAHFVDMLYWLMGDVESVFAECRRRLINMEAEDTAAVILNFANGALGVMEATVCARPKNIEGSITLLWEEGAVKISGKAMDKLEWSTVDVDFGDFSCNPEEPFYSHKVYLQEAFDFLLGKKSNTLLSVYEDGIKSLEIIHAAYESCETGAKITIPFTPFKSKLGKNER